MLHNYASGGEKVWLGMKGKHTVVSSIANKLHYASHSDIVMKFELQYYF